MTRTLTEHRHALSANRPGRGLPEACVAPHLHRPPLGQHPHRNAGRARRQSFALGIVLAAVAWLLSVGAEAAATVASNPSAVEVNRSDYLLSTPQIVDPLRPLAHAQPASKQIDVRTAVVTVADPLETHLGRAFDSQVSALIGAFHSKDYVLDGFALNWNLSAASAQLAGNTPKDSTVAFVKQHRRTPSVLVFRKDDWRTDDWRTDGRAAGSRYFVVFLVGESPTFGVHPQAFRSATQCAALLANGVDDQTLPCNGDTDHPSFPTLEIIGPGFSGSMDSVALVLGPLLEKNKEITVTLRSPSATVESNQRIGAWIDRIAGPSGRLQYRSLAISLKKQLEILADYASEKAEGDIVILAEDSTFGHGVHALVKPSTAKDGDPADDRWTWFKNHTRVARFPQNIAAIRTEHVSIDKQQQETLRKLINSRSQLLELDLSGIGEIADRPPAYHRLLSSRSDELMLYGTFDALRVWVNPTMVVIVATDIRDRLFLLNEVRKALPTALPVLMEMEMDALSAHPDYRKISRGALVIPNGETRICLDRNNCLTSCVRNKCPDKDNKDKDEPDPKTRISFPSDYAANMFRAALNLIGSEPDHPCPTLDPPKPRLQVITLAGFQDVQENTKGEEKNEEKECTGKPRSQLLAADGRLLLEIPVTFFLLVGGIGIVFIASWLFVYGRAHLVMMSPLRHLNPFRGVQEAALQPANNQPDHAENAAGITPVLNSWLSTLLGVLGLVVVVAASTRLYEMLSCKPCTWDLAHGRDLWALVCLFLLYACAAIISGWRLFLWRRRCHGHLDTLLGSGHAVSAFVAGSHSRVTARVIPTAFVSVFVFVAVLLLIWIWRGGPPTAVDPVWPAMLVDLTLLAIGIAFLVALWATSKRLAWLAQLLAPTAERTQDSGSADPDRLAAPARGESWASPLRLKALPASPFNLHFRTYDLAALLAYPDGQWRDQTVALLNGQWPFQPGSGPGADFRAWQDRLVADMRYGAVAIRSCAWSAILAPTALLLGMSLYPPFNERMMTIASVVLIFVAFAMVMFIVIKLEQHPLLGRMFTQSGDSLSIGGVVGALWGKLIAAVVILIPVLFPDVLSELYGLLQSIDSLQ